jgi:hypothetical protein
LLTPDQAKVLAIVIAEGMATRSHVDNVWGFSQSHVRRESSSTRSWDLTGTTVMPEPRLKPSHVRRVPRHECRLR